jgi:DNA-binding transcriptional MerR regulator
MTTVGRCTPAAARRTGLPTSTLRYYERIELLPAPSRTDGGYRAYEERALDRLAFIALRLLAPRRLATR